VVYVLGRVEDGRRAGPRRKVPAPTGTPVKPETSAMLIAHPELVHQDRASARVRGGDLGRQKLPENVLIPEIWWYARFPNHYSGDGSLATLDFGQFKDERLGLTEIVKAARAVKADQERPQAAE